MVVRRLLVSIVLVVVVRRLLVSRVLVLVVILLKFLISSEISIITKTLVIPGLVAFLVVGDLKFIALSDVLVCPHKLQLLGKDHRIIALALKTYQNFPLFLLNHNRLIFLVPFYKLLKSANMKILEPLSLSSLYKLVSNLLGVVGLPILQDTLNNLDQ